MDQNARLYFLSEQFYKDFPDDKLMKNKETIDGTIQNRPCFLAFPDPDNSAILWIIPISSQYDKYKQIEQTKIQKRGFCDTICFGTVLGRKAAFLIQNMCPVTEKYLTVYTDKNNHPIMIERRIVDNVTKKASNILKIAKHGVKVIFPDVFKIYRDLEKQLTHEQ